MSALGLRLRSELRTGWRSWLGLAALIGLLGGVVVAAAAGARRTDTAFPRLLASTDAPDFLVSAFNTGADPFYDDVARLPEVAAAGTIAGLEFRLQPSEDGEILDARLSLDGHVGSLLGRPKLLAGRVPDPDRATEALANRQAADLLGLAVDSELTAFVLPATGAVPGQATAVSFTIVGIAVFPQQVVPASVLETSPQLYLTPAFAREGMEAEIGYDGVAVKLRQGADREAFRRGVDGLAARHQAIVGGQIFVSDESTFEAKTIRAIRPQSLALAAFAVLAGAVVLLVLGQTLSRQFSHHGAEYPALRALGMTRAQRVLLPVARAALVGALGAAIAVAVAVASSPVMPIGPARLAEPDPGLSADLAVLGPAFVVIVVLLVAWTLVPAWRAASGEGVGITAADRRRGHRRFRLGDAAASAGLPPVATTGARMALDPQWGPPGVPVRSTLAGTAVALAAVTAAVTFGINLERLVTTPSLYGRSWDIALDASFGAISLEDAAPVIRSEPAVVAFAGGNYGEVDVDGRPTPAVGIDQLHGNAFPTLLEGRAPAGPDEIVLGTKSLREVGRLVGDMVEVGWTGGPSTMRVVGRAVFPRLGRGSFPPTGLGEGAVVAAGMLPPLEAPPGGADGPAYSFYMVRLRAGADEGTRQRAAERFETELCTEMGVCFVDLDQRPADISNYADVRRTPLVLAGLLILLAVATLGHALATSVRRRRRDLAVLRTIGFVRRQVSGAVAWQATTVATVAGLIGVPLGVVAGRWSWLLFADQVGIAPDAVIPFVAVGVAIPVAVLVANLVAVVPGRIAGRASPSVALRTE